MLDLKYKSVRGQLYTSKTNGQISLILSKKDLKKSAELSAEFLNTPSKKVRVYFWSVDK